MNARERLFQIHDKTLILAINTHLLFEDTQEGRLSDDDARSITEGLFNDDPMLVGRDYFRWFRLAYMNELREQFPLPPQHSSLHDAAWSLFVDFIHRAYLSDLFDSNPGRESFEEVVQAYTGCPLFDLEVWEGALQREAAVAETYLIEAAPASTADTVTVDEICRMAGVAKKTVQNAVAIWRRNHSDLREPFPWNKVRLLMIDKWPTKAHLFPDDVREARSFIAARN